MAYYMGIILLEIVTAILFWKLGYARGMLEAMQEQTAQEQVKMWTNFYGGDDE